MTIAQCLDKIAKLLDYFSVSGNRIPKSDGVGTDYRYRALALIDTAQKELCVHFPIQKSVTMSQRRHRNLLPETSIADVGTQTVYECSGGAALTFLTDARVRVSVQRRQSGGWSEYAALETAKHASFHAYVLRFAPEPEQRIVFSSEETYAYVGNLALYAAEFASDDEVPPWRSFRSHPLPSDFYRFEDISFQPSPASYAAKEVPYTLGWNTIEIARGFDGAFLLVYRAMCQTVDESTPEDTVLPIGDVAAELIPYYAAAILAAEANPQLSQQLMSIYQTKLLNLDVSAAIGHIKNDFYGGGGERAI